ncbi:SHOCT domain-containing protein [Sporosalibacterium faouarense]|uniref:SHOCT domain-containing protein n=1 Tax=Sporosalibacterium faouarense TaxID=516123 RepID=UPI00141CEE7F|nr:SHOCT domain-containing protein [Sporosalibacterium faouarense]MTI48710.1 hypothetical protein [Bacillota bacterium]
MSQHMFNFSFGLGWLWMIIGSLLKVAIVVAIVVIIVKVLQNNKRNDNSSYKPMGNTHSNRAIEILKERYARGEIDEEEYKSKLNQLKE